MTCIGGIGHDKVSVVGENRLSLKGKFPRGSVESKPEDSEVVQYNEKQG